jgi:hypothetical protein
VCRLFAGVCRHYAAFVAGVMPTLHQYVYRTRIGNKVLVTNLLILLKEMNGFLYDKYIPQRQRQKLFRDFKVIDILVEMLKAPFSTPCGHAEKPFLVSSFTDPRLSDKDNAITLVSNAIFSVLGSFLKGDSRKNELYIAGHIPFFWNMFGTDMEIEKMFTVLVSDNSSLVSMFKEEHIQVVVNLLKGESNPYYLSFLGSLCVCEGHPRRLLQDVIGKQLFHSDHPKKKHPFFYTTTVETDPQNNTKFVRVTSTKISDETHVTLKTFFASEMDGIDSTTTPEVKFLNQQLVLFGQLCKGRHAANIATIGTKYIPWEECFLCASVSKNDIPILLKTFYTTVLMNLFVDVDPNRDVLSEVQLNHEWEQIGTASETKADANREESISGAIFPNFGDVHEWIVTTLRLNDVMFYDSGPSSTCPLAGTAQQQNEYLTAVLKLLHKLVIFGYYTNAADIDEVLILLMAVLDGETDQEKTGRHKHASHQSDFDETYTSPHEKQNSEWKYSREGLPAQAVHACKQQALYCVGGLLNIAAHTRIRTVLADFKNSFLSLAEEEASTFWGLVAHESSLAFEHRKMVSIGTGDTMKMQIARKLKKKNRWSFQNNRVEPSSDRINNEQLGGGDETANDVDHAADDPPLALLDLAMNVVQGMAHGSTDVVVSKKIESQCHNLTGSVRS